MSDRNLTTTRGQVFGHVEKGTECRICGRNVTDGRAVYCSDYCRSIANAVMNLLNWTSVRRIIIDRDGGACQECGFKQEWIDNAYGHMQELCEQKLPERPEGPSMEEYSEWKQEELEDYWQASEEWRERRNELIEAYFNRSWRGLVWPSPKSRLEVDHITPISEGGHPFDPSNLRTLCEQCHQEKTAKENSQRSEGPEERPEVNIQDYLTESVSSGVD